MFPTERYQLALPEVGFHLVTAADLQQLVPLLNRTDPEGEFTFWLRNTQGLPIRLHPSLIAAPVYHYDAAAGRLLYGYDALPLKIAEIGDSFAVLADRRMIYIMPRRFDPRDPESLPALFRQPYYRRVLD